jgi:hypothetical protein
LVNTKTRLPYVSYQVEKWNNKSKEWFQNEKFSEAALNFKASCDERKKLTKFWKYVLVLNALSIILLSILAVVEATKTY